MGGATACAPIDRSLFDPRSPIAHRLLPLQVHIIDPNIEFTDKATAILPEVRIIEARYIIKKDFTRNVFASGHERYGHVVLRIDRKVSSNASWLVAQTFMLYTPALFGVPIASQHSEIDLTTEIRDRNNDVIGRYTSHGEGAAYSALYWGRFTPLVVRGGSEGTAGTQAVHAEALAAALADLKSKLESDAAKLNSKLRAAAHQ
jgi:hypothetical protein